MPAWESGESNLTSRISLQGSRPARELQSTWLPLRKVGLHGIGVAGNVVGVDMPGWQVQRAASLAEAGSVAIIPAPGPLSAS